MGKLTSTHTFAELELSKPAYDEIATKLRTAGYDHVFMEDGTIDMHGIGVTLAASTVTPQDGGPVTTEQLDVLQFGRPLHERPCGMFTDNSTPAEMAEFLRSCGSDTGDQIAKMLERLSTTATPPAPGAERAADYLKKLHRNLIGWLAARYVTSLEAAQTVAADCDKHIDKSGRLLGEVREAVHALPRAEGSGGGA